MKLQKKLEQRKLFDNDLLEKKRHRIKLKETERDFDIDDFPLTRSRPVKIDRKIFALPVTSDLDYSSLQKSKRDTRIVDELAGIRSQSITNDRRLTFAKSEIEKKRERYEHKLQQERVISHNNQMRELAKKKNAENNQKLFEFQRRLRNLEVTSFFEQRKNVERIRKIEENQKIRNEQLEEKRGTVENEKQENIRQREKLERSMRKEDEDFLRRSLALLEQQRTSRKNTIPLLKCIRAASHCFRANRSISLPKNRTINYEDI